MEIKYDQSHNLTLFLSREEDKMLIDLQRPTRYFEDIHILPDEIEPGTIEIEIPFKGVSYKLKTHIYLGYSHDKEKIFKDANRLKRLGKISISSPWEINLSKRGIQYYKEGWPQGIMYNKTNKLFIKGPKNAMDRKT